jgi:hypothetical protein
MRPELLRPELQRRLPELLQVQLRQPPGRLPLPMPERRRRPVRTPAPKLP